VTRSDREEEHEVLYRRAARGPRVAVLGVAATVVAVGLVALLIMFIAGWQAVPVDQIGLHYSGGPIEGQHFVDVIPPGSGARFLGLRDTLIELPVTQRDYIVSLDPDEGDREQADVILAPARGGVQMQVEAAVYFTLNTGQDVVRRFYERVCIKFQCTGEDGWRDMLNNNLRKPLEQAIQQAFRTHSVDELYGGAAGTSDTPVLVQIQDEIAQDLKDNVNQVMGGDYFCGPTFDRSHPDVCPDFEFIIVSATPTSQEVIDAFAANAASQRHVTTAENNANAAVAEADGQRRAAEALASIASIPGYIAYLQAQAMQTCAGNNNCTLVVTPGDSNVNVNTGPPG
jgi:hypothetical protein